jgi:(p)ppGpp synthase/HD superfamily hydrolase
MINALEFARQCHATQLRKYTNLPYITHVEAVLEILKVWGFGDNEIIMSAAALHDTVEDTQCSISKIRELFGDEVAELVWWLTDLNEPNALSNRDTRALMTCWRLARAPAEAQLIKLADVMDNTSSIARLDPQFAGVYLREKQRLLDCLRAADAVPGILITQVEEAISHG